MVAQHVPDSDLLALGCPTHSMVLYDLALGCPTVRSGTRLPNTPTWSPVSTWVPTMCSGLLGCTYHSISINELHTNCDIMRHLRTNDCISGGYLCYTMNILYFIFVIRLNCVHTSSMNIVIIWASVYWHTCSSRLLYVPCLFHDVTVLPLKF